MNILVTGATGLVGSTLTRQLVAEGGAVRILCRPTSKLESTCRKRPQAARSEAKASGVEKNGAASGPGPRAASRRQAESKRTAAGAALGRAAVAQADALGELGQLHQILVGVLGLIGEAGGLDSRGTAAQRVVADLDCVDGEAARQAGELLEVAYALGILERVHALGEAHDEAVDGFAAGEVVRAGGVDGSRPVVLPHAGVYRKPAERP